MVTTSISTSQKLGSLLISNDICVPVHWTSFRVKHFCWTRVFVNKRWQILHWHFELLRIWQSYTCMVRFLFVFLLWICHLQDATWLNWPSYVATNIAIPCSFLNPHLCQNEGTLSQLLHSIVSMYFKLQWIMYVLLVA
jgi:hypothetical protein